MSQCRIRVRGSLKKSWRMEGVIWSTERSEEDWNLGDSGWGCSKEDENSGSLKWSRSSKEGIVESEE